MGYKKEVVLKLILKRHSEDGDMIEMYVNHVPKNYLMAVCHQDCFEGQICDRLYLGETVVLDTEISFTESSRLLDIFAKEGFGGLSAKQQIDAIEHIERCLSDLAYAGWSYDDMVKEIAGWEA